MNESLTRPIPAQSNYQNPYLPNESQPPRRTDNSHHSSKMKNAQDSLYLSRFNGEVPEERLRQTKLRSTKLRDTKLFKLSQGEEVVSVHEEKPLLNSALNGQLVKGFEEEEFQNKNIKKFTLSTITKARDMIKESNYFDQTHDPTVDLKPVTDKDKADFRIGNLESFETFQIKTYLFDRN